MVRFDDKKRLLHSLVGSGLAFRGDRDHPSAGLEHAPGSLESFTPDGVEHDIYFRKLFVKACCLVVENLLGTQTRYKCKVSRGGRRNHMRTMKTGQLYREETHGTCSAVHEHALSSLELCAIEQPLPRSQRSDRNRSGFSVR